MRSCCKLVGVALCLTTLVAGAFAAKNDENEKSKSKDKAKKESGSSKKKGDKKESANDEQNRGKISLPILKDHPAFGLKIPYFDTEGKLQMVFNIGRASRMDDDHVEMGELKVETFDEEGESEMMIDMPASVLDLKTRVITTDKSVIIRRTDFEISGEAMEFNTDTKQGKLSGNVRMLIYELTEAAGGNNAEDPAPNEQPKEAAAK